MIKIHTKGCVANASAILQKEPWPAFTAAEAIDQPQDWTAGYNPPLHYSGQNGTLIRKIQLIT